MKLHGPEEDASLPHEVKVIVEQDYRELFVYHVPYLEPDDERLNLHKPVAVTLEQAGTGAGVVMMLIVSDVKKQATSVKYRVGSSLSLLGCLGVSLTGVLH